jgi:hypothetical protein
MSLDKPVHVNVLTVHKVGPVLGMIAMAVTIYISPGMKL